MKTYRVDLDYESFLFDPNYIENSPASLKIIREFEYVFFIINKEECALKNVRPYDKSYLAKLKNLGFTIPALNPGALNAESFWGNRHNYALEQILNSKITSAKLAKEYNWGFYEGAIVKSTAEVSAHIAKYPQHENWIIKRSNSFSGIGHYQFNSKSFNPFILDKILIDEVLLEPLYKRVFDIGTTFVVKNGVIERQFMVENLNSPTGGFKGGIGSAQNFKKYIFEKYSYNLESLEEVTKKIARKYIELGAINNIQIDSFIYEENNELKIYPLVEVNYRKTMGLVIQTLADKYPECNHITWFIKSPKELTADFYAENPDLVRLSPDGTHFISYLKKCTSDSVLK